MSDHEQTLKPGSQLEEFRIEKILGEGGFGITYLAFDKHFQKHVAIKEYYYAPWCYRSEGNSVKSRTNCKEDFKYGLDSFLQEARTIAKFEHPNIVKVIRFFQTNGTAYIVMEYIEGQTLESQIEDFKKESEAGMFNEEEMLFVLQPIINGLKQLHRTNVYHRDLKPENIMLRKKGSPVLIDFGSAREATGNKSQDLSMIVTEGYSPLEQYNSTSQQGPWTDIYALAAVSYACLTGEKPDPSTHRILGDKVIPLVEGARGQGSLNFLKAVDNALAILPEDRPQTLEEWWEQLTQGEQEEVNDVKATRGNDAYLKEIIEESQASQGCQRLISYQGKTFNVTVPAGTQSGTQLKLVGKGEQGKNGGENGDLYIEVIVEKTAFRGSDIYRTESIKEKEANKGCYRLITYQGKTINFQVPANTKSGTQLKVSGKGEPGKNGGENGDLYIEVKVKKPKPKNGFDIHRSLDVGKFAAKIGFNQIVTNHDDQAVVVEIPQNCANNERILIEGKGTKGKNGGEDGNLIVTVKTMATGTKLIKSWFTSSEPLSREGFLFFSLFYIFIVFGPLIYLPYGFQVDWINSYLEFMGKYISYNYILWLSLICMLPILGYFPLLLLHFLPPELIDSGANIAYLDGALSHMAVFSILVMFSGFDVQKRRYWDFEMSQYASDFDVASYLHVWLPLLGTFLVLFECIFRNSNGEI